MKEAVELVDKYNTIRENEQRWEDEGLEDADYVSCHTEFRAAAPLALSAS